ncbi:hypothetical protein [Botrimarina sp.]|uniref:hypothetical protein n=1 Tax=Botrimarina sp. TaxID=2795802 RepID=UPI0032EDBB00
MSTDASSAIFEAAKLTEVSSTAIYGRDEHAGVAPADATSEVRVVAEVNEHSLVDTVAKVGAVNCPPEDRSTAVAAIATRPNLQYARSQTMKPVIGDFYEQSFPLTTPSKET